MNILVTGGAGYIGSITTLQLIAAGHRPVILDNLHNAKPGVIDRIEEVAGTRPTFVRGDVRDGALLGELLAREAPDLCCLQEIKAPSAKVPEPLRAPAGYHALWHGETAYSGVSLLVNGALAAAPPAEEHGRSVVTHT